MAAVLCLAALLVLIGVPRTLMVNLGFLDLMKSRLTSQYPNQLPAVYEVVKVGDPELLDRAKAEFNAALRLNTDDGLALAGLAYVYADEGRLAEAIISGLDALDAGYTPVLGNLLLGNLYAAMGNRARIHYWEAAAGHDAETWIYLAKALHAQRGESDDVGRWGDGILVLEDGLATLPLTVRETVRLHLLVSDLYAVNGDPGVGLFHAERAVAIDPANAEAQGWLAWYLDYYLDDTRALSQAYKALDVGPDWRAFLVVGDSHLAWCMIPSAIAAYESGLSTPTTGDWRRVYLLIGLGIARWENHEARAAIEAWQLAADWQPGSEVIRQLLSQAQLNSLPRNCEGTPS